MDARGSVVVDQASVLAGRRANRGGRPGDFAVVSRLRPLCDFGSHVRCGTDDGVRLWVNNQLLIDRWFNQATTFYNADWGGNWTELGFTNSPLTFNPNSEEYEVDAQQRIGPLERVRTGLVPEFQVTAIEMTADHVGECLRQIVGVNAVLTSRLVR